MSRKCAGAGSDEGRGVLLDDAVEVAHSGIARWICPGGSRCVEVSLGFVGPSRGESGWFCLVVVEVCRAGVAGWYCGGESR